MATTNKKVSPYDGVIWDKVLLKWKVTVRSKGILYQCGYFDNDRDAAKARDRKILALRLDKPLQILKPVS
jgi:hypothetical protein